MTRVQRWNWLPYWVFEPGLGFRRNRTIFVGRQLASDPELDKIQHGWRVELEISPEASLMREIKLPKQVAKKARQAIEVELRQTLPLQGKGFVWRIERPVVTDTNLVSKVYILKATQVQALQSKVRTAGAELVELGIQGKPSVSPFLSQRRGSLKGVIIWSTFSLLLPGFFFSSEILADWKALDAAKVALPIEQSEIVLLSNAAVVLRDKLASAATDFEKNAKDLSALNSGRNRLWLLSELSRVVPDDYWFTDIKLNGPKLHLTGYATSDVVSLVTILQDQTWVHRAALQGPTSYHNATRSTFFEVQVALSGID